jgi:hypothetical protein
VLLPDNAHVSSALLDQKPARLKTEVLGDDTFAVLSTPAPSGKHRLELVLATGSE